MLQSRIHRDMLQRVIRVGDHIAHTNSDIGSKLVIGRVTRFSRQQIYFQPVDSESIRRAYPTNVLVITQQIAANLEGNVGGGLEIQQQREQTDANSNQA